MINDVYKLHSLEEYVATLEQETVNSNELLIFQDSLLIVRELMIETQQKEISTWKDRYTNQKEITRQERRAKRRWRIGAIVGVAVMGYLVIKE